MTDAELIAIEVQANEGGSFPADVVLALVHEAQARGGALLFARRALRPFAAFDPPRGCGTRDECVVYGSNVTGTMTEITVGDFRRARAALSGPGGAP